MKKSMPILLLAITLLIAVMPNIIAKNANATNSFYSWGALQNVNVPNGEYSYEWYICNLVPQWLPSDWIRGDFYEDNTNSYNLYSTIYNNEWMGNPQANLWVGDFLGSYYNNPKFDWGFYSGGYYRSQNDHSWDYQIYTYTTMFGSSNQFSNFIWTCSCGGTYFRDPYSGKFYNVTGPQNYNTYYGYYDSAYNRRVGMPYAWTGTLGMSLSGYNSSDSGNYLYIGWENNSPYLMNYAPNAWTINYYFLYMYYYFGSGQVDGSWHTTHDSLDYAARFVFNPGQNYQGCSYDAGWKIQPPLYSRLRVYGNSINP